MRINALVTLQDALLVLRDWATTLYQEFAVRPKSVAAASGTLNLLPGTFQLISGTSTVILPEPESAYYGRQIWTRKTAAGTVTVRVPSAAAKVNGLTSDTAGTSNCWTCTPDGWWSNG